MHDGAASTIAHGDRSRAMTALDDGRARRLGRHEVPARVLHEREASRPLFLDEDAARRLVSRDHVTGAATRDHVTAAPSFMQPDAGAATGAATHGGARFRPAVHRGAAAGLTGLVLHRAGALSRRAA